MKECEPQEPEKMDQKGTDKLMSGRLKIRFCGCCFEHQQNESKFRIASGWALPLLAGTVIFDELANSVRRVTTKKIILVTQDDKGGQETMERRDYWVKELKHFLDHYRFHRPKKPLWKWLLRILEQGAGSLLWTPLTKGTIWSHQILGNTFVGMVQGEAPRLLEWTKRRAVSVPLPCQNTEATRTAQVWAILNCLHNDRIRLLDGKPVTQGTIDTVVQGLPPAPAPYMILLLRPQEGVKETVLNPLPRLPHRGFQN